ncbi:DNA polymerase III subunit delta [Floccifex sp.]|uniref:DNA polymerase III subunit delta n=1 Tax=Floccifex sp. TaxID=2815810 RepID=UPI003F0EDAB9
MNIILYGSDVSRRKQKISALKKKYQVMNTVEINAQEQPLEELLWEIDNVSIFDDVKMVIVNQCSFLMGKDTTHYDVKELIKRSDDSEQCIIVYCCDSNKFNKKKNDVKELLSTVDKNNFIPCIGLDDKNKKMYIREYCQKIGLEMDYDALDYFTSRVSLDTLRIENELDKLRIYASRIHLEDVQALMSVEPLQNIFKMVDALKDRNALLFIAYYRNFRKLGSEPVAINALLASQMRFMFQVRVYMDVYGSKDVIAEHLKAHPYRVQMTMKQASKFGAEELLDILAQLSRLDQGIKTGKIADMDQAFEQFAFDLLIDNKKEGQY